MTDKRFGIELVVGKEICYFLKDNHRNYTNADTTTQTYKFGVSGTKESAMEVADLLNELYEKVNELHKENKQLKEELKKQQ